MRVKSFKELGEEITERAPRLGDVRVVAVDGRAGSGKTTFGARVAAERGREGVDVALLHTDDLLGGWGHPANFAPYLRQWILDPLAVGGHAGYRVYDWVAERFGSDWRYIGHPDLLVIEGVGVAAAAWRQRLSYSVMIVADSGVCLQRGLARDGEALRPQWETWRAQEDDHFEDDRTETHVDVIVDGNPSAVHDPDNEFVIAATG